MSERSFITDRTMRWRQSKLRDFNREEIDTIEKFGCQVLSVAGESGSPSFAYTFGLFDTCGLPEIVEVGLPHKTPSPSSTKPQTVFGTGLNSPRAGTRVFFLPTPSVSFDR
jgi:hypothetical protein